MPNKNSLKLTLQKLVDLLKFSLTTDDEDINRTIIESVIEVLEEKINS
jgi:hypothetical protein